MDFDRWMKGQEGTLRETKKGFERAAAPVPAPPAAPVVNRRLPVVIPEEGPCQHDLFKPDGRSFAIIPDYEC